MLVLDVLGVAVAVLVVVALPGWLLVKALFPRAESLRWSERVFLTVAGGVLVAMAVGIVLGFLPHGGRGFLQSLPTRGMPYVEVAMLAVSFGLFWVGVRRGAFPTLARRYPRLAAVGLPGAPTLEGGEQKP